MRYWTIQVQFTARNAQQTPQNYGAYAKHFVGFTVLKAGMWQIASNISMEASCSASRVEPSRLREMSKIHIIERYVF